MNYELTVDLDLYDALRLAGLVEGGTDVDAFVVQVSLGDDESVFLALPSEDEGLSFHLHPILGPGEVSKRKIYRQLRARRVLVQFKDVPLLHWLHRLSWWYKHKPSLA